MTTIPFSDSATAASNTSGGILFKGFQQPRVGMWRTGSLSVIRSDGGVVAPTTVLPVTWKAFVGPTTWGGWYNDQPSNLVQTNGPPVTVQGTNLAPSTSYQCVYTGYDSDAPPPLSPLPVPAPPPTAPRVIVSNNVALPAGQTVQIGTDQPVIVGTGLEIFEAVTFHQGAGSSVRLFIRWSVDGSFVDPTEWTFDLSDSASVRGLVLPHLAPFVRFLALSSGQEQINLTVVTGLPPIVRPPIVEGGVLYSGSQSIPATGSVSFALPPYIGDVMFSAELASGPVTGFDSQITMADYLGNSLQSMLVQATQLVAGVVSNIVPIRLTLPPLICSVVLNNRNAAPATGNFQVVTVGP